MAERTENNRQDTRKAMAFDLICIMEEDEKETYTKQELVTLIREYIARQEDN